MPGGSISAIKVNLSVQKIRLEFLVKLVAEYHKSAPLSPLLSTPFALHMICVVISIMVIPSGTTY